MFEFDLKKYGMNGARVNIYEGEITLLSNFDLLCIE